MREARALGGAAGAARQARALPSGWVCITLTKDKDPALKKLTVEEQKLSGDKQSGPQRRKFPEGLDVDIEEVTLRLSGGSLAWSEESEIFLSFR